MTTKDANDRTEDQLQQLGDPSGKQTSEFWDEWFEIVCKDNHRPFEWYCSVEEVVRVLRNQIDQLDAASSAEPPRMIHPGSGNSLLPVQLRDQYSFPHKHVVVDISKVALDEMRLVHDRTTREQQPDGNKRIEYLLGNVLESPLPLESNSFQAWVDKGLIDALFKDSSVQSSNQCKALFDEGHRLLSQGGIFFIVTLGEDHSLKLVIENWCRKEDLARQWHATSHIFEMQPVSGTMRPFGFLMRKSSETETPVDLSVMWHTLDGSIDRVSLDSEDTDEIYESLRSKLISSREAFKHGATGAASSKGAHILLATLEIKPHDADDDLRAIGQAITNLSWHSVANDKHIQPQWHLWKNDAGEQVDMIKIVPIGYGISKLLLQCVIESGDIDDLVETIYEWDGGGVVEDGLQSVDVNWDNTFPVGDSTQFFSEIARGS
jgi:translation elongation factor EF-1beta